MMTSTGFIFERCVHPEPFDPAHAGLVERRNSSGVTLVELLVALLISGMALFGLAVPFFSEQLFWRQGDRQAEAQRDAQVVLRVLARAARMSSGHNLAVGTSSNSITFNLICPDGVTSGTRQFTGTPGGSGQFRMTDSCSGQTVTFIDGNRSEVTDWEVTAVSSQSVSVRIEVTRKGDRSELLETGIYLRNAA